MSDPKIAASPGPAADKMPYPPIPAADLGPDAEAAVQSAQTFTAAHQASDEQLSQANPRPLSGRWHTPLLLIVAAIVGALFLLAIR